MILKKGLSILISLCMILTITPITAYADEQVVAQIQESASQEEIAQEDDAPQPQEVATPQATESEASYDAITEPTSLILRATAEDGMIVTLTADRGAFSKRIPS